MVNNKQYCFDALDRSYYSLIKKEIHALAAGAGFAGQRLAEVDLVVAEILSNLGKYTRGGQLLVKLVEKDALPGLEIISVDQGPGMSDVPKMQSDGYSSKNTLGHGLGSIKRLSDQFHIYSQNGWGTILLSRIFKEHLPAVSGPQLYDIHSTVCPKPGETHCGDGFYYKVTKDYLKVMLGDGLGHGPEAEIAVEAAINAFKICPENSPVEMIRFMDRAVKKTRGLVASVGVFDFKEQLWRLCGVGNISVRMHEGIRVKNHLAYNGIIGLNIPKTMNDQTIPYERNQYLVMCSDGIKSKWDVTKWPGIFRCDLSVLTAAVFKDFARGTDDLSVAVCKVNP
ncbi:SpoIIE family protein phosphatase [Paraflavisolibacter sp. H34]|uniref:SpoIIE family protein phosphatase n=1 Tax=Huijunlia imazamoxiresistens TaxID=3127457 RepID=UPI00301ABEAF